jgi:hypothetical protein
MHDQRSKFLGLLPVIQGKRREGSEKGLVESQEETFDRRTAGQSREPGEKAAKFLDTLITENQQESFLLRPGNHCQWIWLVFPK